MPPSESPYFVYFHTHWDREWYEPFASYQVRLGEVVDAVLNRLDEKVLPCFTLDGQTSLLADYLEIRPENENRLRHYIENGQINIGPWYVMPDEFLVSGESLIRNLKRGIEESREWGCTEFTGYLPDTFGHCADMPMILNQFGMDSAVIWRGANPVTSEFIWKSRTGDSVLSYHLVNGYFHNMLHDPELSTEERVSALDALLENGQAKAGIDGSMLVPIGGDHLGPITETGRQLLDERLSTYRHGHPVDYLKALRDGMNGAQLPEISGELMDNSSAFLLPGVWSARLYLKQANRRLEYEYIPMLESLTAMSQLLFSAEVRPRYPRAELEKIWTLLLQNQPHDSICGCSVDEVHRENEVRFDAANHLFESTLQWVMRGVRDAMCVQAAEQDAQTSVQQYWLVVNATNTPYSGVVYLPEVEVVTDQAASDSGPAVLQEGELRSRLKSDYKQDILDVPQAHREQSVRAGWIWVEDVPPHGIQAVTAADAAKKPPNVGVSAIAGGKPRGLGSKPTVLENEFLRVEVERGTVSVHDKRAGTWFEDLWHVTEQPDQGDSYNSAPVPGATLKTASLKNVAVETEGPAYGRLRLMYDFADNNCVDAPVIYVALEAGNPLLMFEAFLSPVRDSGCKVQVVFKTDQPVQDVFAETHFGVEQRTYEPAYDATTQMPAEPWTELKTNTGPIQRFVWANGQYWVTEGLTEYEVKDNQLSLTLFRSFGQLSDGGTGVRGAQAGPPFETWDGYGIGRVVNGRWAWSPMPEGEPPGVFAYQSACRFVGNVMALNDKPVRLSHDFEDPLSLLQWDNSSIVSSAVKYPDEGHGLIARLFNVSGEEQEAVVVAGFGVEAAFEADFMEVRRDAKAPLDLSSPLRFAPYEVKTIRFQVQ